MRVHMRVQQWRWRQGQVAGYPRERVHGGEEVSARASANAGVCVHAHVHVHVRQWRLASEPSHRGLRKQSTCSEGMQVHMQVR